MVTIELLERARCTTDEKMMVIPTMEFLLRLAFKARFEGLLALEEEIPNIENSLFRKLLQMIVDGVDGDTILDTGGRMIVMSDKAGQELLLSVVILEGVLRIQNNDSPYVISEILSSFLGDDWEMLKFDFDACYARYSSIFDYPDVVDVSIPAPSLSDTTFEGIQEDIQNNHKLSEEQQEALRSYLPSGNLFNALRADEIAIALLYLDDQSANSLFTSMPVPKQLAVINSICSLSDFDASKYIDLARKSLQNIINSLEANYRPVGGVSAAARLLRTGRFFKVMDALEKESPALFAQINERLVVFEDILLFSDFDVQKILKEVGTESDLITALHGASKDIKEKIFRNVSEQRAKIMKNEFNRFHTNIAENKAARDKIVAVLRHLEDVGEIYIPRGNEIQ